MNEHGDPKRFIHNRGAIVRIKLYNFMTYRSCEFKPGPRLNLLLGANGTGKSSVVCALALGFNGSPKLLGRQSSVQEFIRQGQKKGFIELEVYSGSPKTANPVLRRVLTRTEEADDEETGKKSKRRKVNHGMSEWYINGRKASTVEVNKMLEDYNIQVDNMCQFLPQDKVGEFSNFNKYELFRETIRAALGSEYVDKMKILAEAQQKSVERKKEYERDSRSLQQMKDERDRYSEAVQLQQERQALRDKLELCHNKLPWLQFEEMKKETVALRDKKNNLVAELKNLESSSAIPDEVATLKESISKDERKAKNGAMKVTKCLSILQQEVKGSTSYAKEVVGVTRKLNLIGQNYESAVAKRDEAARNVERYTQKLSSLTEIDPEEYKSLTQEIRKVQALVQKYQSKVSSYENEIRPIQEQISRKSMNLERLRERVDDKLRHVQQVFRENGERALVHVRRQISRNAYQKEVFGPICAEVSASNQTIAQILENCMSFHQLGMYVTQCREDRNTFMQNRLGLSNVNVDEGTIRQTQRPFSAGLLQDLGIDGYLDEFISGPEPVVEVCRRTRQIDRVLCAFNMDDAAIEETLDRLRQERGCPKTLTLFTKTSKVQSNVSQYSGKQSTTVELMRPIKHNVRHGAQTTNVGTEEETLTNDINDYKEQIDTLRQSQRLAEERRLKENNGMKSLLERKNALTEEKVKYNKAMKSLEKHRAQLERCEEDVACDWEARRRELRMKRVEKLRNHHKKVCQALANADDVFDTSVMILDPCIRLKANTYKLEIAEQEFKEHEKRVQALENEVEEIKELYKENREECKHLLQEAKEACELTDDIKEAFLNLPASVEEIHAEIEDLQSALSMIHDQQGIVDKYNNLVTRIEELEPKVLKLKSDLEAFGDEMKAIRDEFDGPVKVLVAQLRTKFEYLFETIRDAGYSCEGTLEWIKDDENNPQKFGIGIKVKFRENQPLAYLSSSVQSGGERSLSTFLYILALQQNTHCPFRLVDEINQGMDAVKERLAFRCLTQESCGSNHAQYFLVTPKLLRNLEYTDDMTVLFVFNGTHVPPNEQFDFKKFIQAKLSSPA